MKAERFFNATVRKMTLTDFIDERFKEVVETYHIEPISTLSLARSKCEQEWPDSCPVRALWLTPETKIGEPYCFLEAALPEPWTSIPGYSDHKATTKGDILALFDRAMLQVRA